jgi:glycine oxidase
MVPRPDGRILVGSTEERVGFDKRNTVVGVSGLLQLAQQLVPSLADAKLERTWAGLRPYRPGGVPFIGRSSHFENVLVAAGHFRAGLQLSPITAKLIREMVLHQPVCLSLN